MRPGPTRGAEQSVGEEESWQLQPAGADAREKRNIYIYVPPLKNEDKQRKTRLRLSSQVRKFIRLF